MTLKFTPVSNSNEHCIITNYQPLPENATSFLLDSQLSSTGHSPANNLFFKSQVHLAYTGNYY